MGDVLSVQAILNQAYDPATKRLRISGLPGGTRPYKSDTVTDLYVDNVNGSDLTGDGSSTAPFLSIAEAIRHFPMAPAAGFKNIRLVTTGVSYTPPAHFENLEYLTIMANDGLLTEKTRTITTDASTIAKGIVVTLDGAVPADDADRGKFMLFNAGTLSGTWGIIVKNVGSVYYVSFPDANAFAAPGAVSVSIQSPQVTIGLTEDVDFLACFGHALQEVNITGSTHLLYNVGGGNLNFVRCNIAISALISSDGSSISPVTSYIANHGYDWENSGMMIIGVSGELRPIWGSVFDGINSKTAGFNYISIYGTMRVSGEIVFRDMEGSSGRGACAVYGGNVDGRYATEYFGTTNRIRALDCTGPIFRFNAAVEGFAGWGDLPYLYNVNGVAATTHGYVIEATDGAHVQIEGGDMSCSAGTLVVSADAGTTNIAANAQDGTIITGGSPAYLTAAPTFLATPPADSTPVTVPTYVRQREVFGYVELHATAGANAIMNIQIETGVGTGVYQTVQTIEKGNGGTDAYKFGYYVVVPPGYRYQFVKGGAGGVIETVSAYSFIDTY